uniref:Uncharacterized protein n=1 Tax=Chaetoceros debilis TaxID=122233 RepID=A0A7S3Q4D9_9STRA
MGVSVEYGNRCDRNDQLPRGSKNTSQRRKCDDNVHYNGDVKANIFRRLSIKNGVIFNNLKDLSPIDEGNEGIELSKKAHYYNVSSQSSDETVSLSDSKSSATSESVSFTTRSPGKANVSDSMPRTRHRSRSSSPFHDRVVSLLCHDATEAEKIPEEAAIISTSRSRDPSPFYERLASQHTKGFTERLRNKPSLPSEHFTVGRVPFYNNVHPSNDFPDGSEVHVSSSITRFRLPTPPPSRRRFDKSSVDSHRGLRRSSSFSNIHERLASTETKASTFKKGLVKDTEQKKEVVHLPLRSQDVFFHRLAKLDTVASSRRKPSPSRLRGPTPYEMSLKKEELRNRKPPIKNKSSVYDRKSTTGTMSWLRKQKTQANRRFKSEYETFGEMRKTAVMRNFEGSTRVKM